jgi:hypothetical protein
LKCVNSPKQSEKQQVICIIGFINEFLPLSHVCDVKKPLAVARKRKVIAMMYYMNAGTIALSNMIIFQTDIVGELFLHVSQKKLKVYLIYFYVKKRV